MNTSIDNVSDDNGSGNARGKFQIDALDTSMDSFNLPISNVC